MNKNHSQFDKYNFNKYEDFNLWLDYWYQMSFLKETKPKSVLEIGKGTGTLEAIMKHLGYQYKTLDINPKTKPDFVADICKIPLVDKSFDTLCAFEVLEHIPFKDVPMALSEMKRVAKKNLVISLPYACLYFSFSFQFFYANFLKPIFKLFKLTPFEPKNFNFSIPLFFLDNYRLLNGHLWEMGRRRYPVKKIKKLFEDLNLKLIKEKGRIFYPYHRFFILKIKDSF